MCVWRIRKKRRRKPRFTKNNVHEPLIYSALAVFPHIYRMAEKVCWIYRVLCLWGGGWFAF